MQFENKRHIIGALLAVIVAVVFLFFWDEKPQLTYHRHQGGVFGTTFSIQYEARQDLSDSIEATLKAFDNSLSMFNPHSTLSAINANRDTTTDEYFEQMYVEARRVWELSHGAFDITVAPLVNFWGFGTHRREAKETGIEAKVDSLRQLVGFDKVQLVEHHIIKSDPRVQLDCGAVAKGQACDVVAAMLARQGCANYLVEIGGEIACRGLNAKGQQWHVGITKPQEGVISEDVQTLIEITDCGLATSGNYRNYYYENGERRSHTIDPRSGYPVVHSLLSATVISSTCMRADALATACMVQGAEEALAMIERTEDAACYLLVAKGDSIQAVTSKNWWW